MDGVTKDACEQQFEGSNPSFVQGPDLRKPSYKEHASALLHWCKWELIG